MAPFRPQEPYRHGPPPVPCSVHNSGCASISHRSVHQVEPTKEAEELSLGGNVPLASSASLSSHPSSGIALEEYNGQ